MNFEFNVDQDLLKEATSTLLKSGVSINFLHIEISSLKRILRLLTKTVQKKVSNWFNFQTTET